MPKRRIAAGDWLDLRVQVTRADDEDVTVWIAGAGQHVTIGPEASDIINHIPSPPLDARKRDKPD